MPVRYQLVIDCADPDRLARAARLAALGATIVDDSFEEGLDHCAVGMKDPEGNEFDIN
jgi:Glyoxalase-like domain